jgi:hypothetical protein
MEKYVRISDNDEHRPAVVRIIKLLRLPEKPFNSTLFKIPDGETPQLITHQASKAVYESRNTGRYTCAFCKDQLFCTYAFDPYNTDGDCLRDK